jgi:hypothetical protein
MDENTHYGGCFGGKPEDNEKKAEQEAKALKVAADKAKKPGANKAIEGPEVEK